MELKSGSLFFALVLALALCLAVGAPAMAEDGMGEGVALEPGMVVQLLDNSRLYLDGGEQDYLVRFRFENGEDGDLTRFELSAGDQTVSGEGAWLAGEVWALKMIGGREDVLLMVYDLGPSDDPNLICYQMVDGQLLPVGSIYSPPLDLQLSPGLITGMVRGSILQTWYRPGDYAVSHDWTFDEVTYKSLDKPALVEVPRAVYPMGTQVTLGADLTLLLSPSKDAETALTLKKGEKVILAASDDVRWVNIASMKPFEVEGNYSAGWFDVGLNTWEGIPVDGTPMEATELFQGLFLAD